MEKPSPINKTIFTPKREPFSSNLRQDLEKIKDPVENECDLPPFHIESASSQRHQSEGHWKKKNNSLNKSVLANVESGYDPLQDVPVGAPLVDKEYSMKTDMMFGWKPKFLPKKPIPLKFVSPVVDKIVNRIYYKNVEPNKAPREYKETYDSKTTEQTEADEKPGEFKAETIYQGYRPEHSFQFHEKFSKILGYPLTFEYSAIEKNKLMSSYKKEKPINTKRPFQGMREDVSPDCLRFDSDFECGNLDSVIRTNKNDYHLYLRVDSNTRGHTHWFYFKVKNMTKGQTVRFSIMNITKKQSFLTSGKRPYVHSVKKNEKENVGWKQAGDNVKLVKTWINYKEVEIDSDDYKRFYSMMFSYTFEYDEDEVSFALTIPYSYSDLKKFLDKYQENEFMDQGILSGSLSGITIPLLTITDNNDLTSKEKQYIVCIGRVHPGESNASWMMEGFLEELLGSSPEAEECRKKFIFKIIPMINPDGVILGNHRTGICGTDLNRQYSHPKEHLHPAIIAAKALIAKIMEEKKAKIFAFFDFHGHSSKKNAFMYGAEFPIFDANYMTVKILPYLLSKMTSIFRFPSCAFTIPEYKKSTSRAACSKGFGITFSYTLEASYCCYINEKREIEEFDAEKFKLVGKKLFFSIRELKLIVEEEEARDEKKKTKSKTARDSSPKKKTENSSKLQSVIKVNKNWKIDVKELQDKKFDKTDDDEDGSGDSDAGDDDDDLSAEQLMFLHRRAEENFLQNPETNIAEQEKNLKILRTSHSSISMRKNSQPSIPEKETKKELKVLAAYFSMVEKSAQQKKEKKAEVKRDLKESENPAKLVFVHKMKIQNLGNAIELDTDHNMNKIQNPPITQNGSQVSIFNYNSSVNGSLPSSQNFLPEVKLRSSLVRDDLYARPEVSMRAKRIYSKSVAKKKLQSMKDISPTKSRKDSTGIYETNDTSPQLKDMSPIRNQNLTELNSIRAQNFSEILENRMDPRYFSNQSTRAHSPTLGRRNRSYDYDLYISRARASLSMSKPQTLQQSFDERNINIKIPIIEQSPGPNLNKNVKEDRIQLQYTERGQTKLLRSPPKVGLGLSNLKDKSKKIDSPSKLVFYPI